MPIIAIKPLKRSAPEFIVIKKYILTTTINQLKAEYRMIELLIKLLKINQAFDQKIVEI